MKRVPSLAAQPSALAAWRAEHPDDDGCGGPDAKGAWARFKDSKDAYTELLYALLADQQGLCGYCEQRLSKSDGSLVVNDYQVEHVSPKSGGSGRALDWRNLMLCCAGGTWAHHKDESRHMLERNSGGNLSCGQAKADVEIDGKHDPRALGWREPVVFIGLDGRMRASTDACNRANIDPAELDHTIDHVLRLNCERLRLAREKVATEISGWVVQMFEEAPRLSPNLSQDRAMQIIGELVGGRLCPDDRGHLIRFWTTERQYLGEPAEAWIHENARMLGFPE